MSAYIEKEFARMTRSKIEFFPSDCPVESCRAHLHPAVEILYYIKGEHRVVVDDMVFFAKPGDLILVRSNTVHEQCRISSEKARHYALKIHPDIIFSALYDVPHAYAMRFFGRSTRENTYFPADEVPDSVKAQLQALIAALGNITHLRTLKELEAADELLYPSLRNGAVALLLTMLRTLLSCEEGGALYAPDRHMMQRIFDGVTYIEQNYAEPITAQSCAAHLCMSYSHFAKQFHAVTGRTFKQYLTYVRISRAETELLTTDAPVTEIAMRAGFGGVSHFIATYRRVRGKTPLDTRRQRSEEPDPTGSDAKCES